MNYQQAISACALKREITTKFGRTGTADHVFVLFGEDRIKLRNEAGFFSEAISNCELATQAPVSFDEFQSILTVMDRLAFGSGRVHMFNNGVSRITENTFSYVFNDETTVVVRFSEDASITESIQEAGDASVFPTIKAWMEASIANAVASAET